MNSILILLSDYELDGSAEHDYSYLSIYFGKKATFHFFDVGKLEK